MEFFLEPQVFHILDCHTSALMTIASHLAASYRCLLLLSIVALVQAKTFIFTNFPS